MLELPNSQLPPADYDRLKDQINPKKGSKFLTEFPSAWRGANVEREAKSLIGSSDPRQKLSFGPVGSIETSGCLACTIFTALGLRGFEIQFSQLVEQLVEKGYRIWKYRDFPKTQSSPTADPYLIEKYGPPVGIGGSVNIFPKLTEMLGLEKTFASSWEEAISWLEKGGTLATCVDNTVYFNGERSFGGHYVLVIGVKTDDDSGDTMVILADNTAEDGIMEVSLEKFYNSLKDKGSNLFLAEL